MGQGVFISRNLSAEQMKETVVDKPGFVYFMTKKYPPHFERVMTEEQAEENRSLAAMTSIILGDQFRGSSSISAEAVFDAMAVRGVPARQGMIWCFVRPRTKQILRETVNESPADVFLEETSQYENEYVGWLMDAPHDQDYSIVGPEPKHGSWYAGISWSATRGCWVVRDACASTNHDTERGMVARESGVEQTRKDLMKRLNVVPCLYSLYEQHIRALEIVTGEPLMAVINGTIFMRIAPAGGRGGWRWQFKEDFETFGLLQAIGYFHTYPPLDGSFLDDASELYDRLARLWMLHVDDMLASDDPRILAQMKVAKLLDSQLRNIGGIEGRRRLPNGPIAAPARPAEVPGYEPIMPQPIMTREMKLLSTKDDGESTSTSLPSETLTHLVASFMSGGFPGVQGAFFHVAAILEEYDIDVFGADGQWVVDVLIDLLREDIFGDFMQWIECASCGEEFRVEISLPAVNDSLMAGGWYCDTCRPDALQI